MLRHLLLVATCLLLSPLALAQTEERSFGDTRIFAYVGNTVPYPEGIVVKGNRVYVSGPATFPTAGTPASQIGVYDRVTGALVGTIPIQGQDITQEHALSCMTFDTAGNLYVIDTQQGVLKLDLVAGTQVVYSPPLPVVSNAFPLPNDLVFDSAGALYITDSFQGALWRVPPGGGPAQLWFQATELLTAPFVFGPNGIRINLSTNEVWFTHTDQARLYALPLVAQPQLADLRLVHAFPVGSGPDGISIGHTGRVYAALAYSNQVVVLTPGSTGYTESFVGGVDPWDAPASIACAHDGTFLVTNHAVVSGNPDHFLVFDVYLNDLGTSHAHPPQ